ncbi:hypothetical protein [Neisseria bergeri]|uniref:hypothetical protein n=1 Tax=Neisseria bergeri TaxID=1906581 RepID=UPI0027E00723|nr:hypothetical protein [Neisseria bergeri]
MAGLLGAPGYSDYIEMQEKKTKEEAEKERKAQDAAALHELRDVVAQWNRKHSKPAIKSENIMAGVRSWQRRVAGRKTASTCRTGTRMRGRTAVLPSGIEEIPNLKTVRAFFRRLNAADTVGLMGVFLTCWSGYG